MIFFFIAERFPDETIFFFGFAHLATAAAKSIVGLFLVISIFGPESAQQRVSTARTCTSSLLNSFSFTQLRRCIPMVAWPKSAYLFVSYFSAQKQWHKKCIYRDNKISRQIWVFMEMLKLFLSVVSLLKFKIPWSFVSGFTPRKRKREQHPYSWK